jgi:hypothetical protein
LCIWFYSIVGIEGNFNSVTLVAVTESYLDWPAGSGGLQQIETPTTIPKDNKGKQELEPFIVIITARIVRDGFHYLDRCPVLAGRFAESLLDRYKL